MKNAQTIAITFAQASDNTKAVVADRYVIHALYEQNKAIVEALGGTLVKGVDGFRAEFKTVKNAKAFIAQAITSMSASEYKKARKTEPKKVEKKATVPAPAKGKKKEEPKTPAKKAPKATKGKAKTDEFLFTFVTDAKGNKFMVRTSELESVKAPTVKKGKGKAEATKPTTAPNAKASKSTKAKTEPKAKTTPKKAKGNCPVDFSALAGKGRAANREAAALMRKAGYVDGTSAEYKAIWAEWCKVR
jgi:hypothetical protein